MLQVKVLERKIIKVSLRSNSILAVKLEPAEQLGAGWQWRRCLAPGIEKVYNLDATIAVRLR